MGELWIAAMARNGGDIRAPQMKAIQAERVELLALLLTALLRRWVEGDEEGFLVRPPSAAASLNYCWGAGWHVKSGFAGFAGKTTQDILVCATFACCLSRATHR